MKSFVTLACALLLTAACQRRTYTPAVDVLSKDGQGLLTILATGFGEFQTTAEKDARQLILRRLIYDGIPDESVADARLPLVPNANQLSAAQRKSLDELMAEPYSERFFTALSKDPSATGRTSELKKSRSFTVRVNYDLLRRDLESRGIIRKFGL